MIGCHVSRRCRSLNIEPFVTRGAGLGCQQRLRENRDGWRPYVALRRISTNSTITLGRPGIPPLDRNLSKIVKSLDLAPESCDFQRASLSNMMAQLQARNSR